MAWPKLKQYLENSWYRWASQDRQTWYAAQFQYWENINIRDMKNWIMLSWWESTPVEYSDYFSYFTHWTELYTVWDDGKIRDKDWTVKCSLTLSFPVLTMWVSFWWYIYVISWPEMFKVNPSTWTSSAVSTWTYTQPNCVLNYANTYLLLWIQKKLYKMDIVSWTETFKEIRNFKSWYYIYWLTQEWNYLKIYTSDWTNTKIHYAKGTFDVEDTWLIQTVTFNGMAIGSWCVTSDQWNDYVLFRIDRWTKDSNNNYVHWEYKLAKISWYNKTDIKWTQTWWWEKIFTWTFWDYVMPNVMAADWVLFVSMDEWVWTFTEYNWWLWWWCVEFANNKWSMQMIRYHEQLYICRYYDNKFYKSYYDLSFHPKTYQNNWFIIGRVFDWWCAWLFKKNDQATITYNMPEWTSMELSYRYDRTSFSYDKSNFLPIKILTDTTNCYDIVVPTTPWIKNDWLLTLENNLNNDLILLENWDWIQLEDLMVCPFNKTWNLLEYRFDLNTSDTTKTPILFEHSLTYYDYMRKYR